MTGTHDNPVRYDYNDKVKTVAEAKAESDRVWAEASKDVDDGKVICLSDLIGAAENVMLVRIKEDQDE
jgi:hypothetical protein